MMMIMIMITIVMKTMIMMMMFPSNYPCKALIIFAKKKIILDKKRIVLNKIRLRKLVKAVLQISNHFYFELTHWIAYN